MSNEVILKVQDICKSFSGIKVLDNVNVEINKGEVHALMGENGAGKSTLIKIITGAYSKDSGQIFWKGKPVSINNSTECNKLGIASIYQELSVISVLTVAQNIFLGREPKFKGTGIINYKKMEKQAQDLIDKYNFPLKATDFVGELGVGLRQLVEILKGLSIEAEVLIMDEPTASLSAKESKILFEIINKLREKGVSIIYISHRLEEVYELSDRLTVLRNGEKVALLTKEQINPKDVIRLMIGKEIPAETENVQTVIENTNEVGLEVRNLYRKNVFKDINFSIKKGEIVGFAGLIGAGRTEVMRAIFGLDKLDGGEVFISGEKYEPKNPIAAIKAGIGFVPEDRREQGFIPELSILKNSTLTNYDLLSKFNFLVNAKEERNMGDKVIEIMDVRPNDPQKEVGLLSGGNQQKVIIGKWIMRDLNVLIVDEPTTGIDVGAKDEIYNLLEDLAQKGLIVIVVSSDLQELVRVSHRVIVMRGGEIVQELNGGALTQSDILAAASGLESEGE